MFVLVLTPTAQITGSIPNLLSVLDHRHFAGLTTAAATTRIGGKMAAQDRREKEDPNHRKGREGREDDEDDGRHRRRSSRSSCCTCASTRQARERIK